MTSIAFPGFIYAVLKTPIGLTQGLLFKGTRCQANMAEFLEGPINSVQKRQAKGTKAFHKGLDDEFQ
jgi:hypothetical protein